MSANEEIAANLARRDSIVDAIDKSTTARIISILEDSEADIVGILTREEVSQYSRERLEALLAQIRRSIEAAYGRAQEIALASMTEVARGEATFLANVLSATLAEAGEVAAVVAVGISDDLLLRLAQESLISFGEREGAAVVAEWYAGRSVATQAALDRQLRNGLMNGEGSARMAQRVRNVMGVEKEWAEVFVRTSNTAIMTDTRQAVARANSGPDGPVKGVYQVTFFDSRTTRICTAYAGKAWVYDENGDLVPDGHSLPYNGGTPRHPNCRSTINPYTKSAEEMGLGDVPPEAAAFFDGKVPAGISGKELTDAATAKQRASALGVEVARLLEAGKIKVEDMVDKFGRQRTTKQIAKIAA